MPKTITLDGVQLQSFRVVRELGGALRVFAEYQITASGQVVSARHVDVTRWLAADHHSAAVSLFAVISQDVAAAELT